MDRICVNVTHDVICGHPVSQHDSGGCCASMRCPCSHLTLSKQDEFDPAEPKGPKSIP